MEGTAKSLQEFVAHTSKTNCVNIGRSTGTVLATGGDDFLVNVWAIGRTGAILSLPGHTSPVTCVCFDKKEESVLAGSQKATIKLFDLERAKVKRTIAGHRAEVTSLDFHTLGNFFASGSLDTNMKLWDTRSRECVYSYKGHKEGVTMVRFSPDSKWVATGSTDGSVKIWDITGAKEVATLNHTHAITSMQFSPTEFILATTSKDRRVRFWDLEDFGNFDTCSVEATAANCSCFQEDGDLLFAAYQDSLKSYGHDPVVVNNIADAHWGRVADMTAVSNKVVACSVNAATVSVWYTDACLPGSSRPVSAASPSVAVDKTQCDPVAAPASGPAVHSDASHVAGGVEERSSEGGPAPAEGSDAGAERKSSGCRTSSSDHGMQALTIKPKSGMANACTEVGASLMRGQLDSELAAKPPAGSRRASRDVPVQVFAKPLPPGPAQPPTAAQSVAAVRRTSSGSQAQPSNRTSANGEDDDKARSSAEELLRFAESKHVRFMSTFDDRMSKLDLVQNFWARGNLIGCLQAVRRASDVSIATDVLRLLCEGNRPTNFKIDMCVPIAPIIFACLRSKSVPSISTSLSMLLLILNGFSEQMIQAARLKQPSQREIAGVERRQRMLEARQALVSLHDALQDILKHSYPSNVVTRCRAALSILVEMKDAGE